MYAIEHKGRYYSKSMDQSLWEHRQGEFQRLVPHAEAHDILTGSNDPNAKRWLALIEAAAKADKKTYKPGGIASWDPTR